MRGGAGSGVRPWPCTISVVFARSEGHRPAALMTPADIADLSQPALSGRALSGGALFEFCAPAPMNGGARNA